METRTLVQRETQNLGYRNVAKLTWAIGADNAVVHISEVENGLKCACTCPVCGRSLIAKQEKVVEHHFAHTSENECQYAAETALHHAAKEILALRKEIVLPRVEYNSRHASRRIIIAPKRRYSIESVTVEQKLGSIIPDVVIRTKGRELIVEVTVTHAVDTSKLRKIKDLGVSCIEINLSNCKRELAREELEEIVVEGTDHKRWLYNMRAEKAGRRMLSEATLLPTVQRGFAWHADGCPISARTWRNQPYANVIHDCIGCDHMLAASGNVGVMCDGFRALRRPLPPQIEFSRLPQEAFEHPEADDPMIALDYWLNKQHHVSESS